MIAEGREDYARLVREKSGLAPLAAPVAVVAPPPNPSVAEMQRKLAAVRGCPHWVRGSLVEGCGCGYSFCKAGKGDKGKVRAQECFSCLGLD